MTAYDLPLKMSRDELLASLTKARRDAEKADAKALSEHAKQEQRYLKAFRAAVTEASKWDYETMKEHDGQIRLRDPDGGRWWNPPSCPVSQVDRIDRLIALVSSSSQQGYTLQAEGVNRGLYEVVTAHMPAVKGLC